jgi:hypothetical protein
MWQQIRAHAERAVDEVVRDLTNAWPGLKSSVRVTSLPNSPVFVDCELYRTGTGGSVGIYLDITIPDLNHAPWPGPEPEIPTDVEIEFTMKLISSQGEDYDEEVEDRTTSYLDELSMESAGGLLRGACEQLVEFVQRNRALLDVWISQLD